MLFYEKAPNLDFIVQEELYSDSQHSIEERGLLPRENPFDYFPEEENFRVFEPVDYVARHLPELLYSGGIRDEVRNLPFIPLRKVKELCDLRDKRYAEMLFRHCSFIVSAYAWADCVKDIDAPHAVKIPANIAILFWFLAEQLRRKPILAYASYSMENFSLIDPEKPIRFNNLRLIQHFTIPEFQSHESGFILPHNDIEAKGGRGHVAIAFAQLAVSKGDKGEFVKNLLIMRDALMDMTQTLVMIPTVCSPDVYFIHVRPWIFYFKKIIYDGVGFFELLKGETGAESVGPTAHDYALRVRHTETELTKHLDALKEYRPLRQQDWLMRILIGPSLKKFAVEHKNDSAVKNAFNEADEALVELRRAHLRLAIQYIKEKGRGDIATGATHYEKFLGQLIKDTEDNMII